MLAAAANESDVEASTVSVMARRGQCVGTDGCSAAHVADSDLEDPKQRMDDVVHARMAGSPDLDGWVQPRVVFQPVAACFRVEKTSRVTAASMP